MHIALTGFMGTGKTVTGTILARTLGWEFTDTDGLIERAAGMAVKDIFARFGEERFRQLESDAVRIAALLPRAVIACGGGAVLREDNMAALERGGIVVCLTARPETILGRLAGDDSRPLLAAPDPLARIRDLMAARERFYRRCSMSVDTTSISPGDAARIIAGDPRVAVLRGHSDARRNS